MGKPTEYVGTAFFQAQVSAFSGKLDPRNWSSNAGQIWRHSYVVPASTSVVTPVTIPSPLPPDRTTDPPMVPPDSGPGAVPPGANWNARLFFEDVIFGGFRYRNILWTTYLDESSNPTPPPPPDPTVPPPNGPYIYFHYEQYECLNTKSVEVDDGGVDVDNGGSLCEGAGAGQVKLEFRKTVRFTQPDYAVDEVNALAEVLVPLALDAWLYTALFNP